MSVQNQTADRIAKLFAQYWVRDNGQDSFDAIGLANLAEEDRAAVHGRGDARSTALMAEAFTDVMGADLDVDDSEHQQIWNDAWQKFRDTSASQARDGQSSSRNKYFDPLAVTSRPLAAKGLLSYRCKGSMGWIMIGAKDDEDAMREARRSNAHVKREDLEKWDGNAYVKCPTPSPKSTGKIWWIADNLVEAKKWEAELVPKGASVELKPEAGHVPVDVIITLERDRAAEILGYAVDDEEWLVEEGAVPSLPIASIGLLEKRIDALTSQLNSARSAVETLTSPGNNRGWHASFDKYEDVTEVVADVLVGPSSASEALWLIRDLLRVAVRSKEQYSIGAIGDLAQDGLDCTPISSTERGALTLVNNAAELAMNDHEPLPLEGLSMAVEKALFVDGDLVVDGKRRPPSHDLSPSP